MIVSFVKPLGATFYGAGPSGGLQEMKFRNGKYVVYLPPDFNSNSRYPLVFLPCVNFSGRDAIDPGQLMQSWGNVAHEREYVVVLALAGGVFVQLDQWYKALLAEIKPIFSIDRSRVLVTGFGDGAHYALHLGVTYPEEFTAVGPVAGSIEGWWKGFMRFKKTNRPKFYFLSGTEDKIITPDEVEKTVSKMEGKGYSVKFEKLEGIGHVYSDEIALKIADWFDNLKKAE